MLDVKSIEWIRRNWGFPIALLAIVPAAAVAAMALAKAFGLSDYAGIVLLLASLFVAVALWAWLRRMPRTKAGKVGFAVAINCDSSVSSAVRNDFVQGLRLAIRQGPNAATFDFLEVPDHFASRAFDNADAEKIRRKTGAQFVLIGRVRNRQIQGKDHEVLNIAALVCHAPISEESAQQFAREFSELLPAEHRIPSSDSYRLLEFTAECSVIVAKYIIGIASAVSGDLMYAERLFKEVEASVSARDTGFLIYGKLKERVPIHLSDIAASRVRQAATRWMQSKDPKDLIAFQDRHEELRRQAVKGPGFGNFEAMYLFMTRRDVTAATVALSSVNRRYRDAVWYLNMAFLRAYSGDLKKATQLYRQAISLGVPSGDIDVVVGQIEPFICTVLAEEPDKVQLRYCLGFVNWQFKGDMRQALRDLRDFLENCPSNSFAVERELADQWIREIETSM